jgi:hypothetical protein
MRAGRKVRKQGRIVEFSPATAARINVGERLSLEAFAEAIRTKVWARVGRANWRPFEEARRYVHSLGLATVDDWTRAVAKRRIPPDIPASPEHVYLDKGWAGFGDWIASGTVATQNRRYMAFPKARAFARSLHLRSGDAWKSYKALPPDVPRYPRKVYRDDGWEGMGDWLGTDNVGPGRRQWRPFREARAFVRGLGLKGQQEWLRLVSSGRLPDDIPTNPNATYGGRGWEDFGHWLGTGRVATRKREFRTFRRARQYAQSLGFTSTEQWWAASRNGTLPADIPSNPQRTYAADGWMGYGDFLGTGRTATHLRQYRPFRAARAFARSLNLKSVAQWQAWTRLGRLPPDLPATPERVYRKLGWKGMGDWLGTGFVATSRRKYRTFQSARAFARSLGLHSQAAWQDYCQRGGLPRDIPRAPQVAYRGRGWLGFGDWLGTGRVATHLRHYRAFPDARAFARHLGLQTQAGWRAFCRGGKRPDDIPAHADRHYSKRGWRGWSDFLGTARTREKRARR